MRNNKPNRDRDILDGSDIQQESLLNFLFQLYVMRSNSYSPISSIISRIKDFAGE